MNRLRIVFYSLIVIIALLPFALGATTDYMALTATVDSLRVCEAVRHLASFGSRVTGYPGADQAAQYLQEKFQEIGLQDVTREEFLVTTPIDYGATLTILTERGGEERPIEMFGLWPNLTKTSSLPKKGIQGVLIDGGSGNFRDVEGKDVEGSIVLMDFNTWNNWLNMGMLGAQAIIFVEPDSIVTLEAEQKFLSVPLGVERFWLPKADAVPLRARLQRGERLMVRMHSRMDWEKRPAWNILGRIPGTDPLLKEDIIVIEAYYDAMSIVPAMAPGAEQASGVTALLELARFFRHHPPARTLYFVATSAHHFGLRGIDDFLQRHARKEEHFIERMTSPINLKLFIGLDLSTQTDELGVWNSSTSFYYKRYFAPFGKTFMALAREVSPSLGRNPKDALVNGISPEAGMSWETFIPGELMADSELVLAAGTPALSFVTVNDARFLVDTPLDQPVSVQYEYLLRQIRLLTAIFSVAFDDPLLFPDFRMRLKDEVKTLQGSIMTFPRRGITPDLPRPGAVAVLRVGKNKSYKGVRGNFFELVGERGEFEISRITVGTVGLEAYYHDPVSGEITYAPNQGSQGAVYPLQFGMDWWEKEWLIVLFPCVTTDFYDIVDPRYLTTLSTINLYDETNAPPEEFGYVLGKPATAAYAPSEPVGVLFTRPGTRVKAAMGSGIIGLRYLLLNTRPGQKVSLEGAVGEGFLTAGHGSFVLTPYLAAKDMWMLDESRIQTLLRHGIENDRLSTLHASAADQIALAENAMREKKWETFMKHTRAALGMESRAYPDVKATQNDVISGIIFYMALLLPCAYFAERLLITAADIRRQIVGFSGIFIAIWIIMSWVHPAFELSNPFVILLAFLILALAILVITLIVSRFNEQMKRLRTEVAVVHETDVGRFSASYTAFMLGISNMKRRKIRTVLTFVTLLFLTFTVLSFTSIKSKLMFNQIRRENEGLYEGALIRNRTWNALEESAYDYAVSNFEGIATVAPRSWYTTKAKNYIKLKAGGFSANVYGVLGLTPQEREITHLDQCLIAGRWFTEEERHVCIIPKDLADLLKIPVEGIGTTEIRLFGKIFTVIGIIDAAKMKDIKDLDDEILTPADFTMGGEQAIREIAEQEQQEKQGLAEAKLTIKPFIHLEPANIILIPYQTLRDVGSPLQSIAVRFPEGTNIRRHIEDFISRLAVTLFAGIRDPGSDRIRVSVYSSLGITAFSGIQHLAIPVLIAALIVLNTMMGSVYERFREIGIYSSVGLAPTHIAFLFIAEACVYAVLGTVAGYLVGQLIAKILLIGGWLQGFTLNYSSLSTVFSSILVMVVVLLSTLYPAWKASQMAVPDVTRKWKLPPPDGDEWRFEFPFTVGSREVVGLCTFLRGYFESYSEESIGIFYTDAVYLRAAETEYGESYFIEMTIWLAPFDLGVS
ncbi:MAG: M28 family peptidase, partial [Candidatus Latescibacteria bacterium]|nr:M28 family peptidase [Candidatus Latescibacterota bacterium]